MTRNLFAIFIFLFSISLSFGEPAAAVAQFSAAKKAFNAKQYDRAISLYKSIEKQGFVLPEVEYNLANAYFKKGELADAVLHYRRAWYVEPRDSDIQANLTFTLNAAGAASPKKSWADQLLLLLSKAEWETVALGAYIGIFVFLLLAQLIRPARSILRKMALLPLAIVLLASGGWFCWNQYKKKPEAVVVTTDATTRYSPVEKSTPHFNIPFAAIVRVQNYSEAKDWAQVKYNNEMGWIKTKYIKTILP